MAARRQRKPAASSEAPTIHEATRASGPSGAILKGTGIDLAAAVIRRQAGLDIVVCGNATMRYFTPELYLRGSSSAERVVKGVEEDWERAIQRYRRRLAKVQAAFPRSWQRFRKEHVCLHDAQVVSMTRHADRFVFVLQQEPPAQNVVLLLFTLDGEPEIDRCALPGRQDRSFVTWMYEEFDLDQRGRCCFEVLLSNGWAVKLRFRAFHYVMG